MKLQKQKSDYKRNYYKYILVLSNENIEKAGFKEGDELFAETKIGEIKLKKK